jgi:mono/diheme cytochrome c family protein
LVSQLMQKRRVVAGLAVVLALALIWLVQPRRLDDKAIAASPGDPVTGARLFHIGGCASCHAAPGARGDDRLKLGGGGPLATRFGTFRAPNISPSKVHGIGNWSLADFANAMQRGVAPDGTLLYPAFPYASYARMTPADVANLYAYLRTLPAVETPSPPQDIGFPFNIRPGIALWQRVFLDAGPMVTLPRGGGPEVRRGQYLVEGPGHCGECHTPRSLGGAGGLDKARWLAGAPDAEGKGHVPNITPGKLKWSAAEIADYLKTGFTPDYDAVGGSMAEVQRNLAEADDVDRAAIAAYLKAVPAQR